MHPMPRRPWWKKKRWWASLLLWLFGVTVFYPLSSGPYDYCFGRGWLSLKTWESCRVIYDPIEHVLVWSAQTDMADEWCVYNGRWLNAGFRHAASD